MSPNATDPGDRLGSRQQPPGPSRCRPCRGHGEVRDRSWCGKTCCPEFLVCLACNGTGVRHTLTTTEAPTPTEETP